MAMTRIGIGYDAHKLVPGRKLILAGVDVPHEYGLEGHSDGDVVTHALIDALLGSVGLGSIGEMFPNSNAYKDANSLDLLAEACERIKGLRINNVDATIVCQEPKLVDYIPDMIRNWSAILKIDGVSIKATTTDHLGYEGSGEGISAMAVVLVEQPQIMKREMDRYNSSIRNR